MSGRDALLPPCDPGQVGRIEVQARRCERLLETKTEGRHRTAVGDLGDLGGEAREAKLLAQGGFPIVAEQDTMRWQASPAMATGIWPARVRRAPSSDSSRVAWPSAARPCFTKSRARARAFGLGMALGSGRAGAKRTALGAVARRVEDPHHWSPRA